MAVIEKGGDTHLITIYREDPKDAAKGFPFNFDKFEYDGLTKKIQKIEIEKHWVKELPHPTKKTHQCDIDGIDILSYEPLDQVSIAVLKEVLSGQDKYERIKKNKK